jgi:hypothetical protein
MSDAWRYCDNLTDSPEAVKLLVQAVMTARATIEFAQTKVNPEDFATVPNWADVQRQLTAALKAAGHPAGD